MLGGHHVIGSTIGLQMSVHDNVTIVNVVKLFRVKKVCSGAWIKERDRA